ncbi:CPBP family intramembrane metalloprotease [Desulfobotulus sp. H1]|uniref:CPBP family intramembrane metalloprotease n=1 Tax=Desulfobotulus pelophilus TaxID=2823377 RepID=A0ABT3ND48_9BACT|nr:CPBP family intramembrane glutamic endopeptidase [Desulfobotulus pelophilus]MCW7755390.1 CPBP family intramembrane metalloprotease [Desulfobotulus pelophilus]
MPSHPSATHSYPDLATLVMAAALLILLEYGASQLPSDWPILIRIGALRLVQCAVLGGLLFLRRLPPYAIGLGRRSFIPGIKTGIGGCIFMGFLALIVGGSLWMHDIAPLPLIRVQLPSAGPELLLFFVVGGIIAPVAEELLFRGFIFSYLRQYGWIPALLISTTFFAMLHPTPHITQWVGGVVFGIAYGISGSLLAPILIHICGNLTLFTLSLLIF